MQKLTLVLLLLSLTGYVRSQVKTTPPMLWTGETTYFYCNPDQLGEMKVLDTEKLPMSGFMQVIKANPSKLKPAAGPLTFLVSNIEEIIKNQEGRVYSVPQGSPMSTAKVLESVLIRDSIVLNDPMTGEAMVRVVERNLLGAIAGFWIRQEFGIDTQGHLHSRVKALMPAFFKDGSDPLTYFDKETVPNAILKPMFEIRFDNPWLSDLPIDSPNAIYIDVRQRYLSVNALSKITARDSSTFARLFSGKEGQRFSSSGFDVLYKECPQKLSDAQLLSRSPFIREYTYTELTPQNKSRVINQKEVTPFLDWNLKIIQSFVLDQQFRLNSRVLAIGPTRSEHDITLPNLNAWHTVYMIRYEY